ncbi:MAG: PAS domain S-box protein [Planctomycetes bacterium]|nr:PAS domain S-box protein [Planctomycetota bacterium]
MNDSEIATMPALSTYEDAVAILQKLSAPNVELLWSELSEQAAETLLRSLIPHGSEAEAEPAPASPDPARSSIAEPDPPEESTGSLPDLSNKTLLDILESAPDAMVTIDGHGTIVLVNIQTEKMFGYDRTEMRGKKIEMLVPARYHKKHVQKRRGFFDEARTRPMGAAGLPLFGVRKDGREFPVEISLSPLKTDHGLLVTSVIRDVTERKAREAELAKAELRYRSLVEEIPAVTFMAALDEAKSELYVSPQIVDLLGFTQREWLEDPVLWHRQLHPEDRERWHIEFARTCATAQPFRSVYRFIARDGRVVWVHGEAKVIRDAGGRPMFLQGVAFDITRMKNAEEALIQLNRTLEERVADRTAALNASNEALAKYGTDVAHEMSHHLRDLSEALSEKNVTPTKRLANVESFCAEMVKMVNGMLEFARVSETAKRFDRFACADLLREVRTELQRDLDACGGRITFRALPNLLAHRESLKAVFRNLLSNAIKYRAKRAPKVHVSAARREDEWLFSVRDNGMGVERIYKHTPHIDKWERLFGLFKRDHVKDADGRAIAGHGIGLAYCRRVVEHHGGKMWVGASEPGQGTTFCFTLPALADATPPAAE